MFDISADWPKKKANLSTLYHFHVHIWLSLVLANKAKITAANNYYLMVAKLLSIYAPLLNK
jgi:hypothetical protein